MSLYLIFRESVESLMTEIGHLIEYNSTVFKVGVVLALLLILVKYGDLIEKKYLISKGINFVIILVISCYSISRAISDNLSFHPLEYSFKYLDLLYFILIVHLILLLNSNWGKKIEKKDKNKDFFIDDKIYEGVIDNELMVNELVSKVNDFYPEHSFSIGINASWGYGKSTFLNRFKLKFEETNKDAIIFWFRVWKNKGSKAIIENFFSELAHNLSPYSSEISNDIRKYTDAILSISPSNIGKIIEAGKGIFKEDDTLENYYVDIKEAIKKIDKQVIILLDDLDRLEAEEIIDTFKIIRALSDFSNVIFISGYDRSYLDDTLTRTKNKYLNKIFQFELNLLPYDEGTIRNYVLDEIREKYVKKNETEDISIFQAFHTLFQGSTSRFIVFDDVLGSNSRFTQTTKLNWNTFLKTYRDCKRFLNEFTFNFSFIKKEDVHFPEYILLKLLFFRYRGLANSIFLKPERILNCKKIDFINNKLEDSTVDFGDVFVYDKSSQERLHQLLENLKNYSAEDIEIIDSVFNKLFQETNLEYYEKYPNSISKIYYIQTYVRNGIAGASYKYSDFENAFRSNKLIEIIKATTEFTPQTMYQVQGEIKSFIFNQQVNAKSEFIKILRGLNELSGSFLPADNKKTITIIKEGKKNLFNNSDDALEEVLTEIIKVDFIGNIDKLLSEIRIDHLRKQRNDLYNSDRYINYENPFELDNNLKDTLLNKLKYVSDHNGRIDLLWEAYHQCIEAIAGDYIVIVSPEANQIMRHNIQMKPHYHYWLDKFDFSHNTSGNIPEEYLDFRPNDFIAQIFSKPIDIKDIIMDPQNKARVESMKINGFKRYIEFINSLNSLPAYNGKYTLERLKKISKVLDVFETGGYKPIKGKEYKEIWDS